MRRSAWVRPVNPKAAASLLNDSQIVTQLLQHELRDNCGANPKDALGKVIANCRTVVEVDWNALELVVGEVISCGELSEP
ncbi:MAG TPA: hypothetical protein DDW52_23780 [Planctomycetaceae bacterium]|nr:hypothetical protein [Planctomycetaceae bacterium]